MSRPHTDDISTFWRPLLKDLTDSFPGWGVMKNVDRALDGGGDVDSIAVRGSWSGIWRMFEDAVLLHGAVSVTGCAHCPGVLHLLAVFPQSPTFVELDVCEECHWRGSTLFTADQLSPLMLQHPDGFRCLRPGVQGVLILLLNGVLRGGNADLAAIHEKRVTELLTEDPQGARACARLLGRGERPALKLIEGLENGDWQRTASLALELRAVLRSLLHPRLLASRVFFRTVTVRACPVMSVLRKGRRIPQDLDAWLDSVGRTHHVVRRGS